MLNECSISISLVDGIYRYNQREMNLLGLWKNDEDMQGKYLVLKKYSSVIGFEEKVWREAIYLNAYILLKC